MTELPMLLLVGCLAAFGVYVGRLERSHAGRYWAAAWVLLYVAAIFQEDGSVTASALRPLGNLFSSAYAALLLCGAFALARGAVPSWVLPLGLGLGTLRAVARYANASELSELLGALGETPLILGAGMVVWRGSQRASYLERGLALSLASLAFVNGADHVARSLSMATQGPYVAYIALGPITVLFQVLALLERVRAREVRLLGDREMLIEQREAHLREEQRLAERLRQAQRLQTLGTLAGGVAHDFNNQLTVILGNARRLLTTRNGDPEARECLLDLERSAEHCAELTSGLLAFARQSPPEPQSVPAEQALREVEKLVRPTLPDRVSLRVDIDPELPPLRADPTQLQRVLTNLAVNARDAVGAGGEIRLQARRATDGGDNGIERAELLVLDDGVGMDSTTRERIFDPFFTTKPVGEGTGLGLAIVYGILEAHDARIDVQSEPGRGTRVRVLWPIDRRQQEPAAEATTPEAPGETPTGHETILLADDEPAVRRITRYALEQRGYQVLEASDGDEAFARFEENRGSIALCIFDYTMPRRSGVQAIERIRNLQPGFPVILMSGNVDRVSIDVPPDVVIVSKPYDLEDLTRCVRELLDRR